MALSPSRSTIALEIYLHALKGNKNIIHITYVNDLNPIHWDVDQFQADLPWVTSISFGRPADIHRDILFVKSTNNDLITFAKEIRVKLDPFSTYIITDPNMPHSEILGSKARVLISFVPLTSGQSLILRLKHSGGEDAFLEVTLGSTTIQLNPSSKLSLTIEDITLYPIQDPGPSESDRLSFEPGIWNDIVIQFSEEEHGHFLHDIELLDEGGLEFMRHSASLPILSN